MSTNPQASLSGSTLSTNNLVVGWDGRVAAEIGSLQIRCGSIMILAGPNGSGKSTALKTVARQIPAVSGSLSLDGRDLNELTIQDFARLVAYVPQALDLPAELTVYELVSLGRNPHQTWWSWQINQADQTAISQAMDQTGVATLRDKAIGTLSGGEKQRAIVAMALAQQSQFLLLDEPTAHLDFKHQLELVTLLKELRQQGLGILAVLHDLNLMARLADEIVLLKKDDQIGTVVSHGETDKVLQPDPLRQAYGVEVAITHDQQTGLTIYAPV